MSPKFRTWNLIIKCKFYTKTSLHSPCTNRLTISSVWYCCIKWDKFRLFVMADIGGCVLYMLNAGTHPCAVKVGGLILQILVGLLTRRKSQYDSIFLAWLFPHTAKRELFFWEMISRSAFDAHSVIPMNMLCSVCMNGSQDLRTVVFSLFNGWKHDNNIVLVDQWWRANTCVEIQGTPWSLYFGWISCFPPPP